MTNPNTLPVLQSGAQGPIVVTLQRLLNAFGITLATNGLFDAVTRNAILRFQAVHGLTTDGIVGPKTWTALNRYQPSQSVQLAATALRLHFTYNDLTIQVLTVDFLDMKVPPSDPIQNMQGRPGFWFELRTATGNVLYRKNIHNPLQRMQEVFPSTSNEKLRQVPDVNSSGTFTVLTPKLVQAQTIALVGSPPTPTMLSPAVELAVFSLKQLAQV